MIAHLRGKLLSKKPGTVVVEVGGVGYQIAIPLSTYYELDSEGSSVAFRVHTHVREDIIALYGFLTEVEEALFKKLISVAGVGPSLALKVLSGLEPRDLVEAIRQGDLRRLSSIPGVGKKTAERVVLELREKMPEVLSVAGEAVESAPAGADSAMREDLLSALVNLGYQRNQVGKALGEVLRNDPDSTFELALKKTLRVLSR